MGVKHHIARKIIEAGADILVVASAIFYGNVGDNIKKFKSL